MTATWELCAGADASITQFGMNNALLATIEGQEVSHKWFAPGKLGYQSGFADLAPWETLKQKLIEYLHLVDARHSETTRYGIEFVEWQVRKDGAYHVFAYGVIEGEEVFAITSTSVEPEGFDLRNAHEFFMNKARPIGNE